MEKFAEDPASLGKAPKKKGAPHTLIVAGAGLRAADIVRYVGHRLILHTPEVAELTNCRAVRKFSSKDNVVAKLVRRGPAPSQLVRARLLTPAHSSPST